MTFYSVKRILILNFDRNRVLTDRDMNMPRTVAAGNGEGKFGAWRNGGQMLGIIPTDLGLDAERLVDRRISRAAAMSAMTGILSPNRIAKRHGGQKSENFDYAQVDLLLFVHESY